MNRLRNTCVCVAALCLLAVAAGGAWAEPVHVELYYVKDSQMPGLPFPVTTNFRFTLWDAAVGGTAVWQEEKVLTMEDQYIETVLGDTEPLETAHFSEQLWVETEGYHPVQGWIVVGEREMLTAAPYALYGLTARETDPTVNELGKATLGCLADEIARWDGKVWVCSQDNNSGGDITAVEAGTGLTGGGAAGDVTLNADIGSGPGQVAAGDHLHTEVYAPVVHDHDTLYYSQAYVDELEARIADNEARLAALEALLAGITRVGNDIYVDGANVHVRNGTGTTDGAVNGLGNLIIGYNELRGIGDNRTGSHNLVVGTRNNYSSFGGLVAGGWNATGGSYAAVNGGQYNTASGNYSSVSGGWHNTAGYTYAAVSGGQGNTANGNASSVSGGYYNTAGGSYAAVSGGQFNAASGYASAVSGGRSNIASGTSSSVAGGGGATQDEGNRAFASYSAILGGSGNIAGDPALTDPSLGGKATVGGGYFNTASGPNASVSGGKYNTASADYAWVSGGYGNTADAPGASVSGGWGNAASGNYSSVSGGTDNTASASYASVSGGDSNIASGGGASVSGGENNTAGGSRASVSGGYFNAASGDNSSVSGGYFNAANAQAASVSGGYGNTASGQRSTVAGGENNETFANYSAILGGTNNFVGDESRFSQIVGQKAAISGGSGNRATGTAASVSGGTANTASGERSSVSGGYQRSVSGIYDWRAGSLFQEQ